MFSITYRVSFLSGPDQTVAVSTKVRSREVYFLYWQVVRYLRRIPRRNVCFEEGTHPSGRYCVYVVIALWLFGRDALKTDRI